MMEKTYNQYFGQALMLSEDEKSMYCILQMGTGNTKETSNLVETWFPYSAMKRIITNEIDKDNYVVPNQFFSVTIQEGEDFISYKFYQIDDEDGHLESLFTPPNYFEGLENTAFFTPDL